jgi:hypothetical protein
VRRSGLDLVPSKKVQKTKLATQEEMAKLKFRALKRDDRIMHALADGWHQHGISTRVAYASMVMSHKDWIKFHAGMDHNHVDRMLACLIDSAEFLKCAAQMMEVAQTRLLAKTFDETRADGIGGWRHDDRNRRGRS